MRLTKMTQTIPARMYDRAWEVKLPKGWEIVQTDTGPLLCTVTLRPPENFSVDDMRAVERAFAKLRRDKIGERVGANVYGRVDAFLSAAARRDNAGARRELRALLKFFPARR